MSDSWIRSATWWEEPELQEQSEAGDLWLDHM
jgi:hypothetical protein